MRSACTWNNCLASDHEPCPIYAVPQKKLNSCRYWCANSRLARVFSSSWQPVLYLKRAECGYVCHSIANCYKPAECGGVCHSIANCYKPAECGSVCHSIANCYKPAECGSVCHSIANCYKPAECVSVCHSIANCYKQKLIE